jgi:hypothetical protein
MEVGHSTIYDWIDKYTSRGKISSQDNLKFQPRGGLMSCALLHDSKNSQRYNLFHTMQVRFGLFALHSSRHNVNK